MTQDQNTNVEAFRMQIETYVHDQGIDLFGVADLDGPGVPHHHSLDNVLDQMCRGIVLGVRLPRAVLDDIDGAPTTLYAHSYKAANWVLDQTGLRVANRIEAEGYHAVPVAASHLIDWVRQMAHISHRAVAQLAGLGSKGHSGLLVNERYGAQIRLATILTDMPLIPDAPAESMSPLCDKCGECIKVCPANAITPDTFDRKACYAQLKRFEKIQGVGKHICGVCVKACRGQARE
jgi:epoxyqueuosine reductase